MRPRIVHITRASRDAVFIQWMLDEALPATPARVFQVERSDYHGSEDWRVLATRYTDSAYVDTIVPTTQDEHYLLGSDKRLAYRIGVRDSLDQEWTYSQEVDLDGNTAPEVLYVPGLGFAGKELQQMDDRPSTGKFYPNPMQDPSIMALRNRKIRNIYNGLRFGHGTEIAILKRKRHGVRCRECYLQGAGTSLHSNCPVCYGVGWEGGYDKAVTTYAKVRDSVPSDQMDPSGNVRVRSTQIGLLAFPRLENRDVIVELRNDNRWELANTPDFKVFRGVSYAQECQCFSVSKTNPIFSVHVDSAHAWDLRNIVVV